MRYTTPERSHFVGGPKLTNGTHSSAFGAGGANAPHFIDNRVRHGFASKSSSGVQMIGALTPLAAQTASITGRIVAFARWRQFHVNKKGTPFVAATAMCNASFAAFAGSA